MIDKVIHLIWLQGFDKLPDRFNDILNTFKVKCKQLLL